MIYVWKCDNCGCVTEVNRRLDRIEVEPYRGEYPFTEEYTTCEHSWHRLLNAPVHVGDKGKGNWGKDEDNWKYN